MLRLRNSIAAAALGCLVSTTAFANTITSYSLNFDVTNLSYGVDHIFVYTDLGSSLGVSTPTSPEVAPPGETLGGGSYMSLPSDVLLMGVSDLGGISDHLVLFTNSTFAETGTAFPGGYNENTLITDLLNNNSMDSTILSFAASLVTTAGFGPNNPFGIIAFSGGMLIGNGQSNLSATPLPSSWSAMLLGLVGFGLVVYRRQNRGAATLSPLSDRLN